MRQRATRMGGNKAPAALAVRVAALMASFSGPKLWLDPSDVSTLQQDSAGTTPVTAAGDPIGRIMDKSGAANHGTQATTTSRPLWQTTFAAFDGTDDSWATASIDFTSTDKVTVVAGIRKLSDAAAGVVAELSASAAANAGSFAIYAPPGATASVGSASRGSTTTVNALTSTTFPAPLSAVLSAIGDIAGPSILTRVNGAQAAQSATSQGGGNYGNYPLFVGRRNSAIVPFNGNLYGLIIIGRLLSPDELWVCERYMAQQAGISL